MSRSPSVLSVSVFISATSVLISTDPKEAALTSIWYYKRKVGLGKSSRQVTSKVNTANLKAKERSDKTKDYEKELKKSGSKK